MRILHTADSHVGVKTHGRADPKTGLNTRLLDQKDRLREIAEAALREGADAVVHAGDVFHTPTPTPTQQRLVLDALQPILGTVPFFVITGNHDHPVTKGRRHALDLFQEIEGIHLFDRPFMGRLDESGKEVIFLALPWPIAHVNDGSNYLEMIESAAETAKSQGLPLLVAGHFTAEGSLPSGTERALELSGAFQMSPGRIQAATEDVRAYVGLGHIHKHQSLGSETSTPVVYSGSPTRVSFGEETEDKGYVLVDLERPEDWAFHALPARRFVTIEEDLRYSPAADKSGAPAGATDLLLNRIAGEDVSGAVVRVRYRVSESQHVDEAAVAEAVSEAHQIVSIEPVREATRRTRSDGLSGEISLTEGVEAYCESRGLSGLQEELSERAEKLAQEVLK